MTETAPLGSARRIAWTAGGAFAAFYLFYTAAPVAFAHATPGSGTRVAVVMLVVIAVQPLVLLLGRWATSRQQIVVAAVALMGVGSAVVPLVSHWPGQVLIAVGFGVFVVASTAWVKDTAPPDKVGRALGVYGFGSAIGGAIGAPIGLALVNHVGITGIAVAGALVAFAAALPAILTTSTPPRETRRTGARTTGHEASVARTPGRIGYASMLAVLCTHLVAVTVYAGVLSGLSAMHPGSSVWLPVVAALALHASLAAGRMVGGAATSRWPPPRIAVSALSLACVGAVGFAMGSMPVIAVASPLLVGIGSGACQTAALTSLMTRTHTTTATDRASAAWNICFDIGLGLGALTTGATAHE